VTRFAWRVPAVLLAASYLAPASMIATFPQTDIVHIDRTPDDPTPDDPTPDPGPKLTYTIGQEIRVYPVRPEPPPPAGFEYLMVGLPAAVLFFAMIPALQRLALRFRLLGD
jgi:hypothetical protein